MANINHIKDSGLPLNAQNTKAQKTESSGTFENVLNKAFDKTQAKEMTQTSVNALSEIASGGMNLIHSADIVSGKTDRLLDMLDAYSLKLQDPEISLRSIEPALEEIQADAGTLLAETQYLTDADNNLKKIATQTVVAAQTEYIKFQRGDYLS